MNQETTKPTEPNTSIADEASSPTSATEKVKLGGSLSSFSSGTEGNRTPAKKRRSRSFKTFNFAGILQSMDPEPQTPVSRRDLRGSTTKKWTNSKSGRKFSFSSPEDYLEYSKNRSSSNLAVGKRSESKVEKKTENKVEKKEEKKPEETKSPNSGKKKNWTDRYRGRRRFSFGSSEEYIEYARSKSFENLSVEKSEELIIKRAQKRSTNSTEFALPSTEFVEETLDDTADVTIVVVEDETSDIESNKPRSGRSRSSNTTEGQKKSCLHDKLTFANIWRILLLWVIIVGIALVFKFQGRGGGEALTPIANTNTAGILDCALCPSGSSVHEPGVEVFLGDFTCTSTVEEPLAPIVYTCGEVEKLVGGSSDCSGGDDSCSDLQEAIDQCCFPDLDEAIEKQIKQTEQATNHFRMNGN